jgi:hypothetical protein
VSDGARDRGTQSMPTGGRDGKFALVEEAMELLRDGAAGGTPEASRDWRALRPGGAVRCAIRYRVRVCR